MKNADIRYKFTAVGHEDVAMAFNVIEEAANRAHDAVARFARMMPVSKVRLRARVRVTGDGPVIIPPGAFATSDSGEKFVTHGMATAKDGDEVILDACRDGLSAYPEPGSALTWDSVAIARLDAKAVVVDSIAV
jgi:hypothetical protein